MILSINFIHSSVRLVITFSSKHYNFNLWGFSLSFVVVIVVVLLLSIRNQNKKKITADYDEQQINDTNTSRVCSDCYRWLHCYQHTIAAVMHFFCVVHFYVCAILSVFNQMDGTLFAIVNTLLSSISWQSEYQILSFEHLEILLKAHQTDLKVSIYCLLFFVSNLSLSFMSSLIEGDRDFVAIVFDVITNTHIQCE